MRTRPPAPANSPRLTSGRPKLACSSATTRSHARQISKPPPIANPFTAAMMGFGKSRWVMPPKPPEAPRGAAPDPACLTAASTSFRSWPAQNARSPAPVSTTALTASSPASSSYVVLSCSVISRFIALRASGRSITMMATRPSRESWTGIASPSTHSARAENRDRFAATRPGEAHAHGQADGELADRDVQRAREPRSLGQLDDAARLHRRTLHHGWHSRNERPGDQCAGARGCLPLQPTRMAVPSHTTDTAVHQIRTHPLAPVVAMESQHRALRGSVEEGSRLIVALYARLHRSVPRVRGQNQGPVKVEHAAVAAHQNKIVVRRLPLATLAARLNDRFG